MKNDITKQFDAGIFSSRKLYQLVVDDTRATNGQPEIRAAVRELSKRGHYLDELADRGLIHHRPLA